MKLDIVYAAESLDGVTAVNLDEPSPGDLERVYQEYLKTLRENRELKQLIQKARNLVHEDNVFGVGVEWTSFRHWVLEADAVLGKKEEDKNNEV